MFRNINLLYKFASILLVSLITVSCVTETIDSPNAMKFSNAAIIAVQDPNIFVTKGSTFAWLPEAVHFYDDKRLANAPVKALIEKEIIKNLLAREMILVESVNGAKYAIAYTAALESSLDDTAIIRRFGLLPGNSQVPKDDSNISMPFLAARLLYRPQTHRLQGPHVALFFGICFWPHAPMTPSYAHRAE